MTSKYRREREGGVVWNWNHPRFWWYERDSWIIPSTIKYVYWAIRSRLENAKIVLIYCPPIVTPEFVMADGHLSAVMYGRVSPKLCCSYFFPFFIFFILGEPDLRGTGLPPATNNVETGGREKHYGQRSHQERFGLIQFWFLDRIFLLHCMETVKNKRLESCLNWVEICI